MNKKPINRLILFNFIPLDAFSETEFIEKIISWVTKREKRKVSYLNVHSIVKCFNNPSYFSAISSTDLLYPDGWGPAILGKMFGSHSLKRVNAADFIDRFFLILEQLEAKIYLLGCEQQTLVETVKKIQKKYKSITICGFHHGFFNKAQEKLIIKELRSKKPNLILIGMGTPKQEQWVHDNWQKLPSAVYWTVGGLFYYISGLKSRAPVWMRKLSLEWFYRLLQEPRRLGVRYTIGNLLFFYYLVRFIIIKKIFYKFVSVRQSKY